ncbi:hypothetical protein GEMRC1_006595 [Eukaryota sp. GEM-RC1]
MPKLFQSLVTVGDVLFDLVLFRASSKYDALAEATTSLYSHILPNVSKPMIRQLLSRHNAVTLALFKHQAPIPLDNSLSPFPLPSSVGYNEESLFELSSDQLSTHSMSDSADESDDDSDDVNSSSESDETSIVDTDIILAKSLISAAVTIETVVSSSSSSFWSCSSQICHQLSLIGVRTSMQQLGLAKFLILGALTPEVKGIPQFYDPYDVFITWSDHDAVSFFKKFGFIGDKFLTFPYDSIGNEWDDCVLLAKFNCSNTSTNFDLDNVSGTAKSWLESKMISYSVDIQLVSSLVSKIQSLERIVAQKDEEIKRLQGLSIKSDCSDRRCNQIPWSKELGPDDSDFRLLQTNLKFVNYSIVDARTFDIHTHPKKSEIISKLSQRSIPLMLWISVDFTTASSVFELGLSSDPKKAWLNVNDLIKNLKNDSGFEICLLRGYSWLQDETNILYSAENLTCLFQPLLYVKLEPT